MAKKLKQERADRPGSTAVDSKTTSMPPAPKLERGELDERQILSIAKAIADPRRMALLRAIAQKTCSFADLRTGQAISAATLSHHMRELESAGLIATGKQGRSAHATLQKKVWKSYVSALKAWVN